MTPWKAAKSCLSKSQWNKVEEPGNQVSGLIHQFPGDRTLRKEGPRKWREKECHLLAITVSLELCSSMLRTKSRFYFIFNWRIIALQCYVGFCHITAHISHNYIYCMYVCIYMCVCVCIYIYIYIYVCMYIYPPPIEWPSYPFPTHPSRSSQNTRLGSLCYTAVPY